MSNQTATARAHTNIALIKYWGKANSKLTIPTTSSLSLTLDHFYTETSVTFQPELQHDQIIFNQKLLSEKQARRISNFLDLVRIQSNCQAYALVETVNHVPTAAGLASSASGFAALAAAASRASGMDLSNKELSRLARKGSGSATRSIYGGLVEWRHGIGDHSSYAMPLSESPQWDLVVIALLFDKKQKQISSTIGMERSKQTSPYYQAWVKQSALDLKQIKRAIHHQDFTSFGEIVEANAMNMHALTISAQPSYTYFNGQTIQAMELVQQLRKQGIPVYFTLDAGPNLKIILQRSNLAAVKARLTSVFGQDQYVVVAAGPGIQYLK
ncbi:diphosphomevalonate decarboxylase [Fructilactobacillus florum]|uniref:diphosphomevalonate decarboxylase n=1 Tax=Fructilactobacillus florum DSM 22689 = JCM 16035 TaxID=1423745 RepID=A0A0R2CJC5_9LACO|nr:diphosphomevalonate decarboxylase [Fructilactobacillus florum]KRM91757.1 hypothetical protein FC87_GL000581 [Fructilactobacillus florum DSM 22689 = JCM 16035]